MRHSIENSQKFIGTKICIKDRETRMRRTYTIVEAECWNSHHIPVRKFRVETGQVFIFGGYGTSDDDMYKHWPVRK